MVSENYIRMILEEAYLLGVHDGKLYEFQELADKSIERMREIGVVK